MTTRALVTGAGGFIGHHLVGYLKEKGYWVRGADVKEPQGRATFVIRAKQDLQFRRRHSQPVDRSTGLICDQTILLTGQASAAAYCGSAWPSSAISTLCFRS